MEVFDRLSKYDFGEVHFKLDKATQLQLDHRAPALGRVRRSA